MPNWGPHPYNNGIAVLVLTLNSGWWSPRQASGADPLRSALTLDLNTQGSVNVLI